MANLFLKQAKQYAATRPAYPPELFDFIASKTPRCDLAWDVGTGSGQAAASVSLVISPPSSVCASVPVFCVFSLGAEHGCLRACLTGCSSSEFLLDTCRLVNGSFTYLVKPPD